MKVHTIEELRDELLDVFENLRTGKMEIGDAKEINNTAGKVIASVKVQLEYALLRRESPSLPFLKSPLSIEATTPTAKPKRIKAKS